MKNKIIIGLVISIVLILAFMFINKSITKNNLEKELLNTVTDYYNNEFEKYMPSILKQNGTLKFDVNTLKQVEKDVAKFEKHKCDLKNTYVILNFDDNSNYSTEIHLDCNI